MEPKTENKSWGIFSAVGPTTPVKRMGINFGAPGDRKDPSGQEWFGYPRPSTRERLEFVFDLKPKLASGGGWYSRNLESVNIQGTDKSWLYSSGARGLQRFEIPLLGKDDPKSNYRVKFHFSNLDKADTGLLDVRLQGEAVNMAYESRTSGGGPIVKEFSNIAVDGNLVVELSARGDEPLATLSAIEVIREP